MGIVNTAQVKEDAYSKVDKVDKELLEFVEDDLLNRCVLAGDCEGRRVSVRPNFQQR